MANAPAFQFYPEAYLGGTALFSHEQKGIYMDMLSFQWTLGRLPLDLRALARLVRSTVRKIEGVLHKFVKDAAGYFNERLEKERLKQQEYRERQAELANRRWNANPDAKACATAPNLAMPAGKSIEIKDSASDSAKGSVRGFEEFWRLYPKKKAKGAAERAFSRIDPDDRPLILPAVLEQRQWASWVKDGGQFIPYPATWLSAKGWLDVEAVDPIRSKETLNDKWMKENSGLTFNQWREQNKV